MKTLFLATTLTLLCSLTVNAKTTAVLDFAVSDNASLSDGMSTTYIFNVKLEDTKKLNIRMITVKSLPGRHFPQPVGNEEYFTKNLGDFTYSQLASTVERLKHAELLKEKRQVVCMIMPSPQVQNNSIKVVRPAPYGLEADLMTLVRSPQGCWLSNVVRPKKQYDDAKALELQSLIKALSMDAAGI